MRRFKYWICAGDLIFIAQGAMAKVRFYPRKPETCQDNICDLNQILEVFVHIPNPIKDDKNKGIKQNVVNNRKKRQST